PRARAVRRLARRVADRLDVVAVEVEHERAVVVREIVLAKSGRPVVARAGRDRGIVEAIDVGARFRDERDMDRPASARPVADPERWLAVRAEAGALVAAGLFFRHVHHRRVAERSERGNEEWLRAKSRTVSPTWSSMRLLLHPVRCALVEER